MIFNAILWKIPVHLQCYVKRRLCNKVFLCILNSYFYSVVVYKFAPRSADATLMKDFLTNLEKAAIELPFIQTAISEILNTDCAVDQLALCRELRFTTNNELKVTYTLDQVLICLIS